MALFKLESIIAVRAATLTQYFAPGSGEAAVSRLQNNSELEYRSQLIVLSVLSWSAVSAAVMDYKTSNLVRLPQTKQVVCRKWEITFLKSAV